VKDEKEDRGFFDNSVFEEAANKSDDTLKAFYVKVSITPLLHASLLAKTPGLGGGCVMK
jgi:hypothetical protein